MELNQSTLRGILAAILSVDIRYVIPKQGNWFNPQEMLPTDEKPSTWVAYRIASNTPRTAPFYASSGDINKVHIQKIATIELQCVGTYSEQIAQSVAAWPLRSDVKKQFETVQGSIMYDDMNAFSTNFYQDGANTVLAWNVSFKVLWVSQIEARQDIIKHIHIGGNTHV